MPRVGLSLATETPPAGIRAAWHLADKLSTAKWASSSGLGASNSVLITFPPQRSLQPSSAFPCNLQSVMLPQTCVQPPKRGNFCCWHEGEQKQDSRVSFFKTLSSFNPFSALLNTWEDRDQQQKQWGKPPQTLWVGLKTMGQLSPSLSGIYLHLLSLIQLMHGGKKKTESGL